MDIFHDWQPREIEAMQRATAWLRSIQPKKKKMSTTNDITGDSIQTKPASKDYRDGWERIYGSGTFQNGNNHASDGELDVPDNTPADGRVCDCEDAPCCGHYEL